MQKIATHCLALSCRSQVDMSIFQSENWGWLWSGRIYHGPSWPRWKRSFQAIFTASKFKILFSHAGDIKKNQSWKKSFKVISEQQNSKFSSAMIKILWKIKLKIGRSNHFRALKFKKYSDKLKDEIVVSSHSKSSKFF